MSINFNSEEFRTQNIIYNLIEQNKPDKARQAFEHILRMEPTQRPSWWHQASERIKIILSSTQHNTLLGDQLLNEPVGVEQNTPLHFAAQQHNTETVQKLLTLGASLFAKDAQGKTALQTIRENIPQAERDATGKTVLRKCLEDSSINILDPTSISYFSEFGIEESTLRQIDTAARQKNTTSGKELLRYIEEVFSKNNSNPARWRNKLEFLLKNVPHTSQAETDYFVSVANNRNLTVTDKQELLSIDLPNLDRLRTFPDNRNANLLMIAAQNWLGGGVLKKILSKQKEEQLNHIDIFSRSAVSYLHMYAKNDFEVSFFTDWYKNSSLQQACNDIPWMYITNDIPCMQQVVERLDSASEATRPARWNTKTKTELFADLANSPGITTEKEPLLLSLLPHIDQSEVYNHLTPLMYAAQNKCSHTVISKMDLSTERLTAVDVKGCPAFLYLLDNVKDQFPDNFFTNLIDELPLNPDILPMLTALYANNHPELGQRLLHRIMEWSPPFGRGLWWNKQAKASLFFTILKNAKEPSHIHDLILLTPSIDHAAVNSAGHTPLFEALNTDNKDLVSLLIINGSKLSTVVDGHSLLYHLKQKFGEQFATSIVEEISLKDRTDLHELLPQLMQEGLTSTAEKIITRIQNEGDEEQKTHLFFALAPLPWDVTKKEAVLTALLPHLNLTQKDTAHNGQTVLMSAKVNQLPLSHIIKLLERDFAQQIVERDASGKSALQYLLDISSFPITDIINQYPLDNPAVVEEICLLFKTQHLAYAHQLLGRMFTIPQENIPAWFNTEAKTKLFSAEANAIPQQHNKDYVHDLLLLVPDIDPKTFDETLFYAIESQQEDLAYTLIMQGARLYTRNRRNNAFSLFVKKFGIQKAHEVLDAIRFEKPDDLIMLMPTLINLGYIEEGQGIFTRFNALTEKPSWWNTKTKTQLVHELFFVMNGNFQARGMREFDNMLQRAEAAQTMLSSLLSKEPPIDFSQRSTVLSNRTILQVAAYTATPPEITAALLEQSQEKHLLETTDKNETTLQLLLRDSSLDPCQPKIIKFFTKFNFLEEDLTRIAEGAEQPYDSKGQALLDYVTSSNGLLRAILQPPAKRTKSKATDLFFKIAASPLSNEEKDELLKNLLPLLDITRRENSSPHRTLFHAIAENHLSSHSADVLLTKEEQFYEKNDTGMSTLGALLEHDAISLNHPILQRFLKTVGIKGARTTQTLWTYLRADNGFWQASGTIASKIAVAFLINDEKRFKKLCASCAQNAKARNEVLKELAPLGAKAIEAILLDLSFTINKTHLVLPPPVALPDKPANTRVEDIRTLYEKYTSDTGSQKQANSASLKTFEDRFTQKAFFGGPATETDLYTNIDKASCNVIAHFKSRIAALDPQNPNPDVQRMATSGNRAARELLSDMHVWFQDCINASEMCAPRIYNNAVSNYMKYVLHKQTDTFKNMLYDVLAEKRSEAITGLFDESQSIHAANQFLHDYARELAIPGYEMYEALVDIWGRGHKKQVVAGKVAFEHMYPHLAVDAVRDAFLGNREFTEKFMVYLKKKAGQNGDAQAARTLLREISILWYKAKTPEEKQKVVNQYLERHSITITDTSSLQNIEQELMAMVNEQEKTLYISSVQELNSNNKMQFTTETILSALYDLQVLS